MKIKLCNSYKRKRKIVCKRKIKEASNYINSNPYGKLYNKMAENFFYYSNKLEKL